MSTGVEASRRRCATSASTRSSTVGPGVTRVDFKRQGSRGTSRIRVTFMPVEPGTKEPASGTMFSPPLQPGGAKISYRWNVGSPWTTPVRMYIPAGAVRDGEVITELGSTVGVDNEWMDAVGDGERPDSSGDRELQAAMTKAHVSAI